MFLRFFCQKSGASNPKSFSPSAKRRIVSPDKLKRAGKACSFSLVGEGGFEPPKAYYSACICYNFSCILRNIITILIVYKYEIIIEMCTFMCTNTQKSRPSPIGERRLCHYNSNYFSDQNPDSPYVILPDLSCFQRLFAVRTSTWTNPSFSYSPIPPGIPLAARMVSYRAASW